MERAAVKSTRLIVLCLLSALGCINPARSASTQPTTAPQWRWERTTLPLVLVVDGLWSEWFHIGEALDKVGFRQRGEMKDLSRYTVIVLVNASAVRFPEDDLERIREFVDRGGGLVVLGGLAAYGNGGYTGTLLEELLPAGLQESYIDHFPSAGDGAKLAPAEQADWPMHHDFAAGPTAYYFHTLVPKAGAKTQLNVGNRPALVSGSFGKGRVVACALTVNGDPGDGVLPFWEWVGWPALLGQAIAWAGGARPVGTAPPASPAEGHKPLTEDELQTAELGMADLPGDFLARAMANPDAGTAQILLNLAVPESEEGDALLDFGTPQSGEAKCGLDVVLTAILPHARKEWGPRLTAVADAMNPNIESRKAALILLGACRDPSAYPLLLKALHDKQTELAALDGLGRLGNANAIPVLRRHFDAVLAPAKLPDGPDRWKPADFAAAAGPAAHAAIALYRLGDPEAVTRLCAFAGNLNLYRRIMWNASKRWPRDPQGQAILKAIIARADTLQEAWDFLVNNVGPIPASQAKAFVSYASTVNDPVLVELLVGAMERSVGSVPEADWPGLTRARSGVIARMAGVLSGPTE